MLPTHSGPAWPTGGGVGGSSCWATPPTSLRRSSGRACAPGCATRPTSAGNSPRRRRPDPRRRAPGDLREGTETARHPHHPDGGVHRVGDDRRSGPGRVPAARRPGQGAPDARRDPADAARRLAPAATGTSRGAIPMGGDPHAPAFRHRRRRAAPLDDLIGPGFAIVTTRPETPVTARLAAVLHATVVRVGPDGTEIHPRTACRGPDGKASSAAGYSGWARPRSSSGPTGPSSPFSHLPPLPPDAPRPAG